MDTRLRCVAVTDVGVERPHNEDSCLALCDVQAGKALLVVADGMGGYQGGDIASKIAIQNLQQAFLDHDLTKPEAFKHVYAQIDRDIRTQLKEAKGGTTCVVALFDNNTLTIANIGDSRAYLYREGSLQRLTKDDSLVQMLLDSGRLTETQAGDYPKRNVIMKALGTGKDTSPTVTELPFMTDDLVLLCTDGLCGVLSDLELSQVLSGGNTTADLSALEQLCHNLVRKAIGTGSTDNVTVACCQIY